VRSLDLTSTSYYALANQSIERIDPSSGSLDFFLIICLLRKLLSSWEGILTPDPASLDPSVHLCESGACKGTSHASQGVWGVSPGTVSKSSYFLGDPPPDPRFLASLGTSSLVSYSSITARSEGERRAYEDPSETGQGFGGFPQEREPYEGPGG
jgi:hypothetical protein